MKVLRAGRIARRAMRTSNRQENELHASRESPESINTGGPGVTISEKNEEAA